MKNNFLVLLFLTCSTTTILAQHLDYTKVPQIQTKATYTAEVQPDKITLSIVLSENNSKGKILVEDLEKKMFQILNDNKIDVTKQLTLKDLSSNFQNYFLKKTDVLKTKNYNLEVSSASVAGKILKELAENDISNVKLLKTEYSKLEEFKISLKSKAVEKAKKQADEMVLSLDKKVGSVLFISDVEFSTNFLQSKAYGLNIASTNGYFKEEEASEIYFDNIRVETTIIVYFELK